ncbi:hypothetical protein [Roseburia sp. 1XD42-69]|uniref:hypothetical protein n=1 Tax=Roseburia sp. 1XD42-69 TaxID=2320088 RepID=UPI000EA15E40|nr:hypothetical protein [Roseburia sp. 1XD42-69]RKJ63610.1 hypothetical protein D7Y06_14295 [Roseburia sp. 1XD42-69]
MKRTGKILFSIAVAGAAISAAAFAVKKYNDRCGKPASDMEPDDGFLEEYFPNQEGSEPSGSDGPGSPDVDGEENPAARGIYLTANEAGFLRYILEGIENIGILTDSRIAGVERLTRKRKISNTDRIREIKNACEGWNSDRELLEQCINDIREVLEGGFPNDLVEYINSSRTAGSDADLS